MKLYKSALSSTRPRLLNGNAGSRLYTQFEDSKTNVSSAPSSETVFWQPFRDSTTQQHTEPKRKSNRILKQRIASITDMRTPHKWFPLARSFKRKWILNVGPTNSGKTFRALEALAKAPSGVYCGPLRLLAGEVWETMNVTHGVVCDLVTGQQVIRYPGAQHVACTIEMVNLTRVVDVAVIDEYQLISDEQRGGAWTRALLGIPAREIYITGDLSRVQLIEQLAKLTGDELEINYHERLSNLKLEGRAIGGIGNLRPGDAVIAFSRKDVYLLKNSIESTIRQKVSVVYGGLPPESRSEQAKLFNDPNSEFKILVGTDCIGMGLNLNIRRVIFSSCEKFDGVERRSLLPSEIRQISGRAGRYNSMYPTGYINTFGVEDLNYVKQCTAGNICEYLDMRAMIAPTVEQISAFSVLKPQLLFSQLLLEFIELAKLSSDIYGMADTTTQYKLAIMIDHIDLTLDDHFTFSLAPVDVKSTIQLQQLVKYAQNFSTHGKVPIDIPDSLQYETRGLLSRLELQYKIVDTYVWLANRYPEEFFERHLAYEILEFICDKISSILTDLKLPPRPRSSRGVHKSKRFSTKDVMKFLRIVEK